MPNQTPQHVEQQVPACTIAHPGLGPDRVSAELARDKWAALRISANGVWRVLRPAPPDRPITVDRPGELVGIDCFFVRRLQGTRDPVWQPLRRSPRR